MFSYQIYEVFSKHCGKNFESNFRKRKIKSHRFKKFQDGCFSERIAKLNFTWKERESDRIRDKGVLIKVALKNICCKSFLEFSHSNVVVRAQAEIWNSMTLLNSAKVIFPGISEKANDSDVLIALLVLYFRKTT